MAKKSNVNIPAIAVIRTIVFLFLGFICFIIYSNTRDFLTESPLFAVKDVAIDTSIQFIDMTELRSLKGKNIFKVDIKRLERRIRSQYPQIAQLNVIRQLPNRILIRAKKRDAWMQAVHKGRNLLIDSEGVAMYYGAVVPDLPVVVGALPAGVRIVPGAEIPKASGVKLAIALLKAIKASPSLSHLRITSLDVTNVSKIDITIASVLHVLLDKETYASKLEVLAMMISSKKIDFRLVKYVDLRFSEPVLGENK